MADSKLSALTEISVPALEDLLYIVDDPSGTPVSNKVTVQRVMGYLLRDVANGRLTLETGVPISTTDQTAKSTVYFGTFRGNQVALYDGTRWKLYTLTERSLALSGLTSGKNYDVFLYDNAGTLTLELSAAWTTDTARADALTTQDGITVKSGATTRRYLGTIRTTATTTTEDSAAKRFVWNMANRVRRSCQCPTETTDNWAYSTATWRQANANTANRFEIVIGLAEDIVEAAVSVSGDNSAANVFGTAGIGIDSTTVLGSGVLTGRVGSQSGALVWNTTAFVRAYVSIGYHAFNWIEIGNGTATLTWYGDAGSPGTINSGITGSVMG